MQIAVVLYDGFTALDAVGPHDAFSSLQGAQVTFTAERVGPISSESGRLALVADAVLAEIPRPDVVVVPGGVGRRRHMGNGTLHQWLRAADAQSRLTIGVGDGSLLLAAAGPLRGRMVACRPGAPSLELAALGAIPIEGPFTGDGKYATAVDGVAGIDLSNHLSSLIREQQLNGAAR